MPNFQKWVNLSFLICGILGWVFLRKLFALVFDPLGWNRFDWLVPPADVAGMVGGFAVFVVLIRSSAAKGYLSDVLSELVKVTWPNRKETVISTGVVAVMLAIATSCVVVFDAVWVWVVDTFLYR